MQNFNHVCYCIHLCKLYFSGLRFGLDKDRPFPLGAGGIMRIPGTYLDPWEEGERYALKDGSDREELAKLAKWISVKSKNHHDCKKYYKLVKEAVKFFKGMQLSLH